MKTPQEFASQLIELLRGDDVASGLALQFSDAIAARDRAIVGVCGQVAEDAINYCRGNDIGSDLRSVRHFVADCIALGKLDTSEDA